MKKRTFIPLVLLSILTIFIGCNDEKEAYFERPSWLEPPIYEVLQEEGRFSNYLKCVDKTLYAKTLASSGLYTVFAPNDEAFAAYLVANNLTMDALLADSTLVNKIVSYSIVYDHYPFDRLNDVLSGGWDSLTSIKKKTTFYEPIHKEEVNGETAWVFDLSSYTSGDMNYKYIPFYMAPVFERNRTAAQAASDYSIFYPGAEYTGRNVQSASVLTEDFKAENGVVHEINQVLEPLPSLENLLASDAFSKFKSMLYKTDGATIPTPYFVKYVFNQELTDFYAESRPQDGINKVYLKYYDGLAFSPNGERYGTGNKMAEQGGFTLFAPNNDAITAFESSIADYYPNGISSLPKEVLSYFINAQMTDELVWPGDFKNSMNFHGEFFNGKGAKGDEFNAADYPQKAPASNGFFYGSNKYIKSRYFETVFTEILLNKQYDLCNKAFSEYFINTLQEELLKCELNGYTQENYTILLPSNELLEADGFGWAWLAGSNKYGFTHSQSGSSLGNFDVATRIQRLVKSHIFKRLKNDEVDCSITDFTVDPAFVSYAGYGYAVNEYGDMIRYKDGKIQMLGNFDENDWVTATPYKTFLNGQVLKIDKLLQYSRRNTAPTEPEKFAPQDLIIYILKMASPTQNLYVGTFKNYLVACLKGDESNQLAGLSADMVLTMFMPNDVAMKAAVANGDLPALTAVKANAADRAKATEFILYHILKGKQFVDDGLTYIMPNKEVVTEEVWPAVLKDVVDNTYLAVRKSAEGELVVSTVVESTGRKLSEKELTVKVKRGVKRSNFFGANTVLHEIDGYLKYDRVIQQ